MAERRVAVFNTQLLRTQSPLAAWALSLGCTVGWGSFIMPGTTFLPAGGPAGTLIAFLIGALAMMAVTLNYGYMARRCPGEGGVYAYVRDAFGPNHAFVSSWCLVLAYSASMVANATALALVLRSVAGSMFQVGLHYQVAGYDVYLGEVALGMACIVLAALVCMGSVRVNSLVETILVIGLTAGIAAVIVLCVMDPRVTVASMEPLFSPHQTPLSGVLIVLATVPWAFIGFEAVAQVTAEWDSSAAKLTRVMAIAIACGTVMYVTLNSLAAALVPSGYPDWTAYVGDLANQTGLKAIPTFYAGYLLAGDAGVMLLFVTALCAVLSGVVGFFVAASRLVHAMALDRALPRRYSKVHERYHTPVTAVIAIMVASLFVPFLGRNVLNWIVDLQSLGAIIAYGYVSMAVCKCEREAHSRRYLVPGMCGAVMSLVCIGLLIVPIPGLGTSLSMESYIILFAWMALGVNFFTPTFMR